MNELKQIMKRGVIVAIIVFILGIIMKNRYLYLGMAIGALLSVIGFYMIYIDAKASLLSNSPFKVGVIGYLKRYLIYGIFLAIATKFGGFPMLVSGVIGLLNVKINILLLTLFSNIKKFKLKYLK